MIANTRFRPVFHPFKRAFRLPNASEVIRVPRRYLGTTPPRHRDIHQGTGTSLIPRSLINTSSQFTSPTLKRSAIAPSTDRRAFSSFQHCRYQHKNTYTIMSASHATDKDKELNHFLAIPWTRELLSQPGLTLIHPVRPRVLKESTEDQLFADVFSTPDTLKGVLTFHATPKENATMVEEVSTLFDLGYRLNGYPGVVHGGVVATIIDESMGIFLSRNQERGAFSNGVPQDTDNNPGDRAEDWVDIMTGELKVKFVRPVKSEQVVRVDVRLAKVEGRKFFVESVVKDEKGTVLARGEGLWIALKGKPKL